LYKIPADAEAADDKIAYIYASNKNMLTLNATECKVKAGCEFEVTSKGPIDATLYIGDSKKENKEEVVIATLKK
jgi:hypothetical protein